MTIGTYYSVFTVHFILQECKIVENYTNKTTPVVIPQLSLGWRIHGAEEIGQKVPGRIFHGVEG